MTIPVFRPTAGEEEITAVAEVLRSGWWGLGPKTHEFESTFARYVNANCAIGVNSATAALHLALTALGIDEGDEVITTSMTFISTNHAILYHRAVPVFADICEDTLNIDPEQVAHLITPHTKAIMIVHYGGHPCEIDEIHCIAKKHDLTVIEDAAHACGAEYKGRRIGGLSDLTCFSFHAVKNLATGDGGMITFNDGELDSRLRRLRWMGISRDTWSRSDMGKYSWFYNVEEIGFKYHMNDITAAIGLVQLAKLERTNARRREIAGRYSAGFADLEWLQTPVERPYVRSSFHNYVIKVEKRDELMSFLKERGVSTSVHYIPNHFYDIYKPYYRALPVAEKIWQKLVTLPLFPDLTDDQLDQIIDTVRLFGKKI